MLGEDSSLLWVLVGTGVSTVLLASSLAYVLFQSNTNKNHNKAVRSTDPNKDDDQPSDSSAPQLFVYYASQTGTAESFARQLQRELVNLVQCQVIDVEDLPSPQEIQSPSIWLVATYGEGEPTDNASQLISQLQEQQQQQTEKENEPEESKQEPPTKLALEFCVFGLGNKQYEHYNAMGKFIDQALADVCKGERLLPLALGNDDDDLEGDFEQWKSQQLAPLLKQKFGASDAATTKNEAQRPDCPFTIEYLEKKSASAAVASPSVSHNNNNNNNNHHPPSWHEAAEWTLSTVRELRTNSNKKNNTTTTPTMLVEQGSTLHIELKPTANQTKNGPKNHPLYNTADNLGIWPEVPQEYVECVAHCLGLNLDATFVVHHKSGDSTHLWFPTPLTVREFLAHYSDWTALPRRADLKLLASYIPSKDDTAARASTNGSSSVVSKDHASLDRAFLLRMASNQDSCYHDTLVQNYWTWVHVLVACPSLHGQIPLEHVLQLVPKSQPRYYTIASSVQQCPNEIHLTVAVTRALRSATPPSLGAIRNGDETKLPKDKDKKDANNSSLLFQGLCSSYLASRPSSIRAFVRPSSFQVPPNPKTPLILIGPGTGIAPMRALLQERACQQKKQQIGPTVLYFGCHTPDKDYLYQNELKTWQKQGVLTDLHVAFSRRPGHDKTYVQHLLAQHSSQTFAWMQPPHNAYIYVCGGVKMGHDVQETLVQIIFKHQSDTSKGSTAIQKQKAAKDYLDEMARQGRYVQELWS